MIASQCRMSGRALWNSAFTVTISFECSIVARYKEAVYALHCFTKENSGDP